MKKNTTEAKEMPLYLIYSNGRKTFYGANGTETENMDAACRYHRIGDAMRKAAELNENITSWRDKYKAFPIYGH